MAVARTGTKEYGVRRPKGRRRRGDPVRPRQTRTNGASEALPGWSDLARSNRKTRGSTRSGAFLESVPTTRFALIVTLLAIAFTMYVGHVHATQDLLADVQQLRRENLQLHLKHNRLKGDFDRMVGPGVIYERAHRLGLVEDVRYGPTIKIHQ